MNNSPAWIDGKHHPEPSVDFVYPGDGTEKISESEEIRRFRRLYDFFAEALAFLAMGPRKSMPIRLAALLRFARFDQRSLKEIAMELHCAASTIHLAEKELRQRVKSNNGLPLKMAPKAL